VSRSRALALALALAATLAVAIFFRAYQIDRIPPLLLFLRVGLATPLAWAWRWASAIAVLYGIGLTYHDYFVIFGRLGELPLVFQENLMAFVPLGQADQAQPLAQHDAPRCGDSYATQYWQVGDVVQECIAIQLSPDLSGDYSPRIRLYHTYLNTWLAITSADRPSQDDALLMGTVRLGRAK
jgi:hypothetical protein